MASTPVRYYDSTMRGLGGIDGTPGSFLTIADKVLMNGYGQVTAINIVVLNGKATAYFNPGEGFNVEATIRVSGANIPVLNGDHFVESRDVDSASWTTTAPNGTTTTTVTVMGAPLGWSAVVTGTNKRGYKSNAPDSAGHVVRIDDTTATYLTIHAYESMSSIDVGLNPNPPANIASEWPKSNTANTAKRPWFILGDNKGFWYGIVTYANATNPTLSFQYESYPVHIYWVGEGNEETPLKTNFFLLVAENYNSHPGRGGSHTYGTVLANNTNTNPLTFTSQNHTVSRDYSDIAISPHINIMMEGVSDAAASGALSPSLAPPWPNPGNGRTFLSRLRVLENISKSRRGTMPGIYGLLHSSLGALKTGATIKGVEGLETRTLRAFGTNTSATNAPSNIYIFDITGPWRE